MQSIKKQLVYDLNELSTLAIKHNVLELVEQIIQTYPRELKARKIAMILSTTLNFEFIEKYPLIFSSDVLSYTLDHLSLLEAQPNVLNGLVKIGATFNSKYMNQDTAEKMNRLLIKTKKGKN
jgi:hypothetical protein